MRLFAAKFYKSDRLLGRFKSEGLDRKTEKQIIRDYRELQKYAKRDDPKIWVSIYCGTFDGYIVVWLVEDWKPAPHPDEVIRPEYEYIAGCQFQSNIDRPNIWKNGKFYKLNALYEEGVLTDDDIRTIHSLCYK